MDISSLNSIRSLNGVTSEFVQEAVQKNEDLINQDKGFDQVFQSALNMVNEANDLQNSAESAEIQFALGQSTNTHNLMIAQQKANIALQFTVAVRDKVIEAYKEIMNMQI